MSEKITGYLLLIAGLLLILLPAWSVYRVLTGSVSPATLFQLPSVSYDLSQTVPDAPPLELVSSAALSGFANIAAHLLLMGFLSGAGFKIASLGTQLLRPVEVRLRSEIQK